MNEKFRKKLEEQRAKIAASGGGDFIKQDRYQMVEGKNVFRILDGEYELGDGLYQVPLFQHWMKSEGKSIPFTCLCHTGLVGEDEIDVSACPACAAWPDIARIADADGFSEETTEAAKKAKKALSFRAGMVMNVVDRKANAYKLFTAPTTTAQTVMDLIIDACTDDPDFDALNAKTGRDFVALRQTQQNNTSYTVTMKQSSTPVEGEDAPSGHPVDLDKYVRDELASGRKRIDKFREIVAAICSQVTEVAAENGDDLSNLDIGAPPAKKDKDGGKKETTPPKKEAAPKKEEAKPQPEEEEEEPESKPAAMDSDPLGEAADALARARALIEDDED